MIELTTQEYLQALSHLPNPTSAGEKDRFALAEVFVLKKGQRTEMKLSNAGEDRPLNLVSGAEKLQFKLNCFDGYIPVWEPVQDIRIIRYNNEAEKRWRERMFQP